MAATPISGLASGLDWQTMVSKLIAVARVPQDNLKAEKTLGQQKTAALQTLSTDLTAVQTSLQSISGSSGDVFAARTANIADASSGWTATADSSADIGTHSVSVTQLATKAVLSGAAGVGNALSSTADVSGLTIGTLPVRTPVTAGSFTVNGARVTVASTDSLQDVLNRISTATAGAVTASYDPTADKINLTGTGQIVLGSANDSSNFLAATGLVNNGTTDIVSSSALGVAGVANPIAKANLRTPITAVDTNGNGTLTINGTSIAYNVNTDSISTVLARINASGAGVTASYDRLNDRFTISNNTTGDTGIAVSEASGGLLNALGLGSAATLTSGKNAQFSVDGGATLTSSSNTLDATAHGIAGLTLTATSTGTQTVTVAADTSGVGTQINNFITAFNAAESYIDQQTAISTDGDGKVTAALLASDHDVGDIGTALRNQVFADVPGLSGTIKRLADIGIDFTSGSNQLAVNDSTKLASAIANNTDDVQTLFTSSNDGLVSRLNAYITQVTGSSGTIATQTASLASEDASLDTQIANMDRSLAQQQDSLTNGFVQMETAESGIQSQLSALNNAFGLNPAPAK